MYNIIELLKDIYLDANLFEDIKISVDMNKNEKTVYLTLKENERKCPYCTSSNVVIQQTKISKKNHPVQKGRKIILNIKYRKYKCKTCGHCFNQTNPLNYNGYSLTINGITSMIYDLTNLKTTFADVSANYQVPIQTVCRFFDKCIEISRRPLPDVICIDEIYNKKVQIHTNSKYLCILYDPYQDKVIDILNSRRKEFLFGYFNKIPLSERQKVKYVNMDMWDTYADVATKCFPNAKICIDGFHVIEHVNNALISLRKYIQRKFAKDKKDKYSLYWVLKTFNHYLIQDPEKIKYVWKKRGRFSYLHNKDEVIDKMLSIDENLKKAYYLKEDYREFSKCCECEDGEKWLDHLIHKFKTFPYEPMRDIGMLLSNWREYILNSLIVYNRKKMSNGPIEGLNSRIRLILRNSYGFTNLERFKKRVFLGINKDIPLKF